MQIAADSCGMSEIASVPSAARNATLEELLRTTIAAFLQPAPSKDTLRKWFDDAGIPRFKSNPTAKRGGGVVYYSVAGVEKFFRQRTLA